MGGLEARNIEGRERRFRTIERLHGLRIPYNPWLPIIETSHDAKLPSARDVAGRAIAAMCLAVKAQEGDAGIGWSLVESLNAWPWLTPGEFEYLRMGDEEGDRMTFSWRWESIAVLLWALQVHDLPWPSEQIGTMVPYLKVKGLGSAEALAAKGLRPVSEILDEADLYYRLHWAVRDNESRGLPPPASIEGEVTWERDRGFRWLVCEQSRDWDDIALST